MRYWRRIIINLLNWILMYLTLDLTIPENFLTYCVYLVTQWHLPLPPFSSTMGYWYEIWRYTTTCNKGVPDDQFCGQGVTGLNPVTSDFSVSCCYFELNGKKTKLNIYLKYVVKKGRVVSDTMFVIVHFLPATFLSLFIPLWKPWIHQAIFTWFLVLWYCQLTFCETIYSSILEMIQKNALFNRKLTSILPPLKYVYCIYKSVFNGRRSGWLLKDRYGQAQHQRWTQYYKYGGIFSGGGGLSHQLYLKIGGKRKGGNNQWWWRKEFSLWFRKYSFVWGENFKVYA